MNTSIKPFLMVRDLVFGYEMRPLTSALHFKLHPGEGLTLFGPNGRGKTTLLETLVGLKSALLGTVAIDERHYYLATQKPFYPNLTLRENFKAYGVLYKKEMPQDLQALVLIFKGWGLDSLQDQLFESLSDGEQRRAQYALGQFLDPNLWLIDEPYVSLDPSWHKHVDDFLKNLMKAGKALLLTQHQPLSFGHNVALEGI